MRAWASLRAIFSTLIFRGRAEEELRDEMRAHIENRAEDLQRRGLTREEAKRQAQIEFGAGEKYKEECRETRVGFWLETVWMDVRYGLRNLRRSPGFTFVAVLTLALGIGVNAAIFGLVDAALLSALPFHEPERLVFVWTTDAAGETHTPLPDQYSALRRSSNAFEQVTGFGWIDSFYGSDESGWQSLLSATVSSNWLPTLGVQPFLGRNFLEEEQTPGQDAVAFLSYGCWRNRFHGDINVVGRQISLNRGAVTIVGVLPASLGNYYQDIEIFRPLVLRQYAAAAIPRAGAVRLQIMARLKLGVTLDQARSDTEAIAEGLKGPRAAGDRSGHLLVQDFAEEFRHPGPTRENARRGVWMIALAAGVVLLIACANVAGLLLSRGVRRSREIAVRAALGCSRSRMIRQLLTESTLLFLFGAVFGLMAARWSQQVVTRATAGIISNVSNVEVNLKVLAVNLGISLLSALLFGMIPALQASRVSVNETLKDAAARATGAVRPRRARNIFIAFQIALGMVLLVGFGLLLRSFLHAENAPFGFDARDVLTASVRLPSASYADASSKARLMRELVQRVTAVPGVESAGIADSLPMEGAESTELTIESPSPIAAPVQQEIWFLSVGPEYFSTLKIPMAAGRTFREQDTIGAPPVAIINRKFAEVYFRDVNPIGYHVATEDSPKTWRGIVGVVSDFRQRNPEEDLRPLVYFPVAQMLPGRWSMAIRLRARAGMGNTTQQIGDSLRSLDPQLYWEMGSLEHLIRDSESLTLRRPIITLLASFGSLAVLLAIVGVVGVTSYSVSERTREIGIRVALGAVRPRIAGMILCEALAVALAGLAVGSFAAWALTHFLPTSSIGWSGSGIYLYGVTRGDSLTYACAATLLTALALAASLIPTRRALRVDPMVALRHE